VILQVQPAGAGQRLDRWLHAQLPLHSRAQIQDWIREGRVRVNGAASKPACLLRGAETIEVEPAVRPLLRAEPEEIPIEVLYEDRDVIAINKPAGMVVHVSAGVRGGTLVNALLHRFSLLSDAGGELRPGIVHRLDRQTSGVLLVARNNVAHLRLARQFASRQVEKVYLALVHRAMEQPAGRIDRPIARDPSRRIRMTARLGYGRSASTEYRVLRQSPDVAFLEIRIGTGRTHQIRAHMAAIGHPVVGDRLYGAPARVEGRPPLHRFFLHAHRIGFTQPSTGQRIVVEAPLPEQLERWMTPLL
jgi:23S rRNA pseudouridine1911/1915/1917 synthase